MENNGAKKTTTQISIKIGLTGDTKDEAIKIVIINRKNTIQKK
jgi:hypothetical protein